MQTQTKPVYKRMIFWQITIAAIVVLALGICLGVMLFRDPPRTGASNPTTQTVSLLQENPYGPEDFIHDGEFLTCSAGQTRLGVDVSYWQAEIDWQQVRSAGISFAMLRLGWRGSEQGLIFPDDNVQRNYEGARQAGIQVGGYFFSQAVSVAEALEEAEFALELIQDWQVDMPIVFDWEYISEDSRTAAVDTETLIACTKAFCQRIEQAGYRAMIYFNPAMVQDTRYLEALAEYEFWLAMYDHPMEFPYQVDMWQYTCTGKVPGIECDVDLNLQFLYE